MSRTWLALLDEAPTDADAAAQVQDAATGDPAGWLAAWRQKAKPLRGALRVDGRIVDPAGAPAQVSLVLAPTGVRLAFDDLAVQQARRLVLAGPFPDAVSTLLSDSSHFEGAVSVIRSGRGYADPFARVFPARRLYVDGGLFGAVPPPAGPTIERYGSAQPWPWDRFSAP